MNLSHEMIKDDHQTQFYFSEVDAENDTLPAHWHNHLEIICVNSGSMTAYINENSYELSFGDILIINPKDIHSTHAHGDCHYFLLQIPTVHLERISPDWKLLRFVEYIPANSKAASANLIPASFCPKRVFCSRLTERTLSFCLLSISYRALAAKYAVFISSYCWRVTAFCS